MEPVPAVVGLASSACLHTFRVPVYCSLCVSFPRFREQGHRVQLYVGRCHPLFFLPRGCLLSVFIRSFCQRLASLAQLFSLVSVPHNMQRQCLGRAVNQAVCPLLTWTWQEKEAVTVKCQNQAEVTVTPLPV